ncbi:MAG TPA: hypothetical protein PL183_04860 [Aquamicrobium sp.]|nr:hypothetical protein [Aquamicrobium sp.]
MPMRTLLMSALVGLIAVAVSGCVSDPYYDGYGAYYDGYGPYYGGAYGGYYAGSAIIYDSGPRVRYRPRYVHPRSHRPHRVYREHGPRHAQRHHRQARPPARDIRRDHRSRHASPSPRREDARQIRGRQGMNRPDRDRRWDGREQRWPGR